MGNVQEAIRRYTRREEIIQKETNESNSTEERENIYSTKRVN